MVSCSYSCPKYSILFVNHVCIWPSFPRERIVNVKVVTIAFFSQLPRECGGKVEIITIGAVCVTVCHRKKHNNVTQYYTVHMSMAMAYDTIYYIMIRYDTIRYDTIRYDTIRYDTIRYDTIRYDTIRYDTIRYLKTHVLPWAWLDFVFDFVLGPAMPFPCHDYDCL